MKRVLLISLSLALALVGWSTVCAQDGFYVIPAMKGKYAPVPKTGQTTSYASKDDGDLKKGVAWPTPRFTDHGNGTVTDNLTGLMWQKNANCMQSHYPGFDTDLNLGDGAVTWVHALDFVAGINNGTYPLCGAGYHDWRLPNILELMSLIDYNRNGYLFLPADHPFTGVSGNSYWSSTTMAYPTDTAYTMHFYEASLFYNYKTSDKTVWCVRGGP
jgi:hypothetical protein